MRPIGRKRAGRFATASPRVSVSELRSNCAKYIEATRSRKTHFVITKRGVPVAQLAPVDPRLPSLLGSWKGRIEIVGDIVHNDWSDEFEILSDRR